MGRRKSRANLRKFLDKKNTVKKPRKIPKKPEPGVTGLFNFSTTCYLNSIIQCLSNTKKLAIYFLSGDYKKDLDASAQTCGKIANSFGNLLQSLWSGENKSVCPKVLRSLICEYAPKYDNKLHHDAHEFLINLRVWLHDELKKPIFRPMQVIWTPKESMWVEQTNGMQSIMLATFAGQMRNNICCDVCQKRKDKYENFQDLSLALPPGESCTLQQCLDNYFSREPIIGYGCPRCRHDKAVYQQMSPATLPSVLVLVLKRFSEEYANNTIYFKKNCIAVNYPLDLKIFQGQYSLYGVVNHVGTLNEGHYTAICKNMKSNKWYLYDDTVVKEVDCNLTLNPVNVYIMFYQLEGEVDQPQILFK